MTEYKYVDHLKEYMTDLSRHYIEQAASLLPAEFDKMDRDILISAIADFSTTFMRGLEIDAIRMAIEQQARLIRYSRYQKMRKEKGK